jgi:DNA-binding NarL/FixJ family response regulator
MTDSNSIRVFIAEDHDLTQLGLKFVLEHEHGIVVIGQEKDGRNTVEKVLALQPEVVLMDIGLPGIDGIEATKQIKSVNSQIKVIMLTSYDNDASIFASFSAGADAYCLKSVSRENLMLAVRAVSEGVGWLDPAIASRVMKATAQRSTAKTSDGGALEPFALTPRELEVLQSVVAGLSNKEISIKLSVSIETVKTHLRHIMEKLAVTDRTQAAVKAMRQGLV